MMDQTGQVTEAASARGGLLNGAASIIGTALAFAITLVITNSYGVASTGVFFAALAAFMIVSTVAKLGVETALVFFVARLRADGSLQTISALLRAALRPVVIAGVVGGVFLFVAAGPIAQVATEPDFRDSFASTLRAMSFFVPVWSTSLCLLGATRGMGTMTPTAIGLHVVQPAVQISLVAAAAVTDAPLATVALAFVAPSALTLVIAAFWLARNIRGVAQPESASAPALTMTAFWSYATPRGAAGSLQISLERVGVLLVGALASAAVAGQWAAVSRLIGVAQRIFHAIGQSLNPRVSALADRNDWSAVSATLDRITQWTLLVLTPGLVALIFFPRTALSLFGDDFQDGARALSVAAVAVIAASVLAHADNVLLMTGNSLRALFNTAAALATSIVLTLVLVPRFDAVGAALAFASGAAVYRLAAATQIRQLFRVSVVGAYARRVLALNLVIVAAPLAIARVVWGDRFVVAAVSGVVAALSYGVATVWLASRHRLELSLT